MAELSILGKRLKESREFYGIPQAALARTAGVAVNTIAALEQGRSHQIRTGPLTRIAKALNVSADYLLGRKNTRGINR